MSRAHRYREYRKAVQEVTAATGIHDRKGSGTVDHIVPIRRAFNWGIPAEKIGSEENLQVLSQQENLQKGQRLTPKGRDRLRRWGYGHIADAAEGRMTRDITEARDTLDSAPCKSTRIL